MSYIKRIRRNLKSISKADRTMVIVTFVFGGIFLALAIIKAAQGDLVSAALLALLAGLEFGYSVTTYHAEVRGVRRRAEARRMLDEIFAANRPALVHDRTEQDEVTR